MVDGAAIIDALDTVTKKWAKQRLREERKASAEARRLDQMTRVRRVTVKEVAYELMEEAYLHASNDGKNPAAARQVMYARRGEIQRRTGEPLNDDYFTQQLLPDYQADYPARTKDWDVVYDARGHFTEPHTQLVIPLGTIDVRNYLAGVRPGPPLCFGAVLFIEKEGFLPLFKKEKLAERFDIAIMSTKGQSVTASRKLVDELCHAFNVPLLLIHDFDKAGFSMVNSFTQDTRRYRWEHGIQVIDLGLRLEDVRRWELEPEDVVYGKSDPRPNLYRNGATEEEVDFLCSSRGGYYSGYKGQRVELNMFTGDDLVTWIGGKLVKNGVKKIVPDESTLAVNYRLALESYLMRSRLQRVEAEIRKQVAEEVRKTQVPKLQSKVTKELKQVPTMSWNSVVGMLASKAGDAIEQP
jgi:hypothetical protein